MANNGHESLNLLHPLDSYYNTVTCTTFTFYCVIKPQFQEPDHLILCLGICLLCLFADLHISDICNCNLLVPPWYHFISYAPNVCKTGSRSNWCLHPFCKQHQETSCFLQPFQSSFQNFKWLNNASSSVWNNSSEQPELISLDKAPNTMINNKRVKAEYWFKCTWPHKIFTETVIDSNSISSTPPHWLYNLNQLLFYV